MASGTAAEENVSLLTQILETGVGYGIELFDLLRVYQLEDGRFAVHFYQIDSTTGTNQLVSEEIYASARKAAEAFEAERRRRNLGFDRDRDAGRGPSARTIEI